MSWGDQRSLGGSGGPVAWSPSSYYKAGSIAVSLVNYQYYARKSDGSSSTDPANDATNWAMVGGRPIKGIQRGVASASGSSSGTATITSVDTTKTELRFLGGGGHDYVGGALNGTSYVWLASSTTVGWNVPGGSGQASWELTEYM